MAYIFPDLCIVCEGDRGRIVIAELAVRVLNDASITRKVEIVAAHGLLVIPRVFEFVSRRYAPDSIVVVVDSDGRHPALVRRKTQKALNNAALLVVAHPNLESWIPNSRQLPADQLAVIAQKVNLARLETLHPEFREFREAVASFLIPE